MTVVVTCFTNEQQNGTVVTRVPNKTGWSTVPGFYEVLAGAWTVLQEIFLSPMEMCLKNQVAVHGGPHQHFVLAASQELSLKVMVQQNRLPRKETDSYTTS